VLDLLLRDKRRRRGRRERPRVELVQPVAPVKKLVVGGREIVVRDIKQVTEDAVVVEDLSGNTVVIPLRRGGGGADNTGAVLL
jgi:hypothetical protein